MELDFDNNMIRLQELSLDVAVDLKDIFIVEKDKVLYKTVQDRCEGVGLFKTHQVAVQFATLLPNTTFPLHPHAYEKEILIVVEGSMYNRMLFTDSSKEAEFVLYEVGDVVEIQKGNSHYVHTVEGCKLIAITIPAAEAYPDEQRQQQY